jgi:phage terminase small subunit
MAANYKVNTRIYALRAAAEKLSTLEASRVLDEIAKLAHSDVSGIMHPDGRIKLPNELDAATRAAVASFEIDAKGTIKYRFWDKNSALDKAAKHLGLFERDNDQQTAPLRDMLASLGGRVICPKKHSGGSD